MIRLDAASCEAARLKPGGGSRSSNRTWPRAFSLLIFLGLMSLACGKDEEKSGAQKSQPSASATLPSADFTVDASTKGALFTWVDGEGSFQITDNPADVPVDARKRVRVVLEGHSPGTSEYVFVVDLTDLQSGAPLAVEALARATWEGTGKEKRDQRVAALKPPPPVDPPVDPGDIGVDAIVYGADWCKPCHLAEDYLKSKGARVVKKDIEEDPSAASEMRQKLKAAGMSGSSIPIVDVGGTILRGFSERAIDAALRQANK